MIQEVAAAIAELKAQGIQISAEPSEKDTDVYVATAPNGENYRISPTALLNLKAKGKLHLEGLQEVHLAKKDTPNL